MTYDKNKHLELIQSNVQRMNQNSFLIKGWAITLVSALFALAAKDANKNYVLVTYICIPIFWGLDAYYLSLEKGFRNIHDNVVSNSTTNYDLNPSRQTFSNWFCYLFSKTILPVYLCLIGTPLLIMFVKGF